MISVDEALHKVLALATAPQVETVDLDQADGRVMLAPARAALDQPPFDAAVMDGYALRADDLVENAQLSVVGEAAAGHGLDQPLHPGQAIRIFTGAPLPPGAGAVVMQEDVTREGDRIRLNGLPRGTHIRPRGTDFLKDQELAPPRLLDARSLALLAAMNVPQVQVARRPRVAILATGDELVPPGTAPGPGQIICSNTYALAAMARAAGAEAQILPIARDTETSLRDAFASAADADLIVTIGGASVGDYDLVGQVAAKLGLERSFYKIAMRPGKPLMAGRLGRSAMLGLPGNPVSSIVCGLLFMQPLIRMMQGLPHHDRSIAARLGTDIGPAGNRTHFMRATLTPGEDLPRVAPFGDQDSGLLSLMSRADGLLIRPADDGPRQAGEIVRVLPF
ncbi:gephyrin-like molybdotransferase Glp [Paracoccus sp. p4-l81]|uniref:molybdopterin molybdotransferase MoeA n=1 Tax=Paracoccus sp. p4-l81 TaxID=3342806 RepID=UPI0035B9E258